MTAPPRSPPYLKIWIRYCGLLAHALPMLVFKIFLTPPPPPRPLMSGSGSPLPPPRSPPYLKVWFRHCRLLALLMLVYKIWRVNCDKQDWKDEEMGQKLKKQRRVEVSQLFLPETVALVTIQNSDNERWNYCVVGCSYSMKMNDTTLLRQLTMISTDPCRHNLKTLFLFWSQNFI